MKISNTMKIKQQDGSFEDVKISYIEPKYCTAEGLETIVEGVCAHAEGMGTTASNYAHAEGEGTIASGTWAHAEGAYTKATNKASHAEGADTEAFGEGAHAEGSQSKALKRASHAEGQKTIVSGDYSHAEGEGTIAMGKGAHAEGFYELSDSAVLVTFYKESQTQPIYRAELENENNMVVYTGDIIQIDSKYYSIIKNTTLNFKINGDLEIDNGTKGYYFQRAGAAGDYSHSEGYNSEAKGEVSHAEGEGTVAFSTRQHVQGKYNIRDTKEKYAHIVGNGTDNDNRSNAHTLDWDGNAWFAGDVICGANNSKLTQIDLLWKNNSPTEDFIGYTIDDYLEEGLGVRYLSKPDGTLVAISDYDGFFVTYGYDSTSILNAAPCGTIFISTEGWQEISDNFSGNYNELPSVQLMGSKNYNAVRRIRFLINGPYIDFLVNNGVYYKTYGTSTTTTDEKYCIPLAIYGIKNINK